MNENFTELRNNFAERLVTELGVPAELADKINNLPMRVDEDENINKARAEWLEVCKKSDAIARERGYYPYN